MQPVKRKREPSRSWFAFLHPAPPAGPLSGVALGACSSGLSAVLTPKPAGLGRSDYLVAVGLPPPGFPVCVSTGWRPVPAPRHVRLSGASHDTHCVSLSSVMAGTSYPFPTSYQIEAGHGAASRSWAQCESATSFCHPAPVAQKPYFINSIFKTKTQRALILSQKLL